MTDSFPDVVVVVVVQMFISVMYSEYIYIYIAHVVKKDKCYHSSPHVSLRLVFSGSTLFRLFALRKRFPGDVTEHFYERSKQRRRSAQVEHVEKGKSL